MEDFNIEKLVSDINFSENFIGYRKNDIVLTNKEIEVLDRNKIEYKNYSSIGELLYEIDEVLEDYDDEELENIAVTISDRSYYLFTNK